MSAPPEFVETEAKSVLNRVEGMPFKWSINPYRGCSHACTFCLSGNTPVLMADGTTRTLEEIRIGDQVYGTVGRGNYRRYARTFVLNHWSVEKPAYRVTLEDGTQLISGADHRFLTERGWKFVIGAEQGPTTRPHLTTNNKLMGTGKFAISHLANIDYKRGYLCGLIRGDGLLRFYQYERKGRTANNCQFRLALTDGEALERAQEYLLEFGVPTRRSVFLRARAGIRGVRQMDAIGTTTRSRVEEIESVVAWPVDPSPGWQRGFLAGIFDAEGGYRAGILRITNSNPVIINCTARCLERAGFSFAIEWRPRREGLKPLKVVRLRGGLREHLRFLHSVDPAISRKRDIEGHAVKHNARLRVVKIEPVGVRQLFDITTGTGDFIANGVISHNCYARRTHWFLDEDGIDGWSSKVFVKVNAPEILRRELARPGWKREEVALGTATDPYQAAEGRYRITRAILAALIEFRTPASIVTRSPMILRDVDRLVELARRAGLTVCLSIATTDPALAREIEPTVAAPAQRLKAVAALAAAGVRTGVLLAPVLPGLTDARPQLAAVIQAARDHGAHFVWHNTLHLGEITRDAFMRFLGARHPNLVSGYTQMYPGKYAPAPYRAAVTRIVEEEKSRAEIREARYLRPPRNPEQLPLALDGEGGRSAEAGLG